MNHWKAKKFSTIVTWVTACVLGVFANVGCSGNFYAQNAQQGYEYCTSDNAEGSVQSIEIFARRSPSNPTFIALDIRPDSVLESGVGVSIYLANQFGQFRVLEAQIPIDAGQEYYLGSFPDTLYENYDLIVVTPFEAGASFLDADGTNTTVCNRPLIGDGLDQNGDPVGSGTN